MVKNAVLPSLPRRRRGGIAYYAGGSGDSPLLFIHGVGLCADCWHAQITATEQKWRVFALDLPGHGESEDFSDLADFSPQMSDFTSKITDFIENEIGAAVTLIGHSLGALIALQMAAQAPQWVHRAVLLSTVYNRDAAAQQAVAQRARALQNQDAASRSTMIDATLARWFGETPAAAQQDAAAACRHWLQRASPTGYAAAYRVFASAGAEATSLQQLSQPLLYLTGEADANSTAQMTRELAQRSPAAQAEVVAGHAHMLQLTAAAQVNALLLRWLEGDYRQSVA